MNIIRRILTGATLLVAASGIASANSVFSTSAVVTFTTDGSYTLTLNKFNSALGTLTGVKLYFFGSEDVSTLNLTNSASSAQDFDLLDQSNLNQGSNNTANSSDKYTGEVLDLFDTGIGPGQAQYPTTPGTITLGPAGSGPCPEYTPSNTCNSVSYTPPDVIVSNTDAVYGFTVGTGLGGVTGVVKTIASSHFGNYTDGASGTFALTGSTKNLTTFSGGGGNISLNIATSATFQAEVDYTYTPVVTSSTPEPATMLLFGTALLGLGLLRKRARS